MLAEWSEKLAWISAPEFILQNDAPVPFIGREQGFIDQKVIEVLTITMCHTARSSRLET
jgi:hypothetical protein